MLRYRIVKDHEGEDVYEIDSCGLEILHNPILNKGSAFPPEERRLFRIEGLLPPAVSTLEQQVERRYEGYSAKSSDLEKYIYLRALQDRNETLFYALLLSRLEEMIPIVYTPTVGLACQRYSHIFRYTRGIFLSPGNIDRVDAVFRSLAYRNVEMIVATDSEGILGIGDQGVGGMGIPVGKLSLYVAGAGIHPANCLPVTIDVGTDNEERLGDPLYLGIRSRRIRGDAYFDLIDRFAQAVKRHFPGAILQWEDFSKQNAFTLLDRYRRELPSFNDDIQGTGAVVLAGILGAMRITGGNFAAQRFAILGAGAGGIGVARQIRSALRSRGLPEREAAERIFVVDRRGVVAEDRSGLEEYKKEFARGAGFAAGWTCSEPDRISLLDTIRNARPTVLLGLSGTAGAFTEEIVRAMASQCERPVIFPLSNPTGNAEATPEAIYRWTDGRAVVATGSPFPPVRHGGREFQVGQGNNVYIFPGVGLAALLVGAKEITDGMFTAAAERLADLVPDSRLGANGLYPPLSGLREICREIAVAVSKRAMEEGHAAPVPEGRLREALERRMWSPRYARYRRRERENVVA